MSDLKRIHDVLIEAVLAGGTEVLRVKKTGLLDARFKHGKELVTEADQRSDAAILAVFRSRFPEIDAGISFHLEESGETGGSTARRVGADPVDGTNHFACGGNLYAVQAHYVEDGLPLVGVVFQPEVYLPMDETAACAGRVVSAIRGEGAFTKRTTFEGDGFTVGESRFLRKNVLPQSGAFVACVPYGTKMAPEDRERARRVHESGIISSMTGAASAGANVMMTIFGGQHVYANFGAGEDLDLIPPQVIAMEAGLTVWGVDRRPPAWHVRKQPVVFAPDERVAEMFLRAAGL
ncbi:MAG TPA: inositol monophosphatase family protein [Bryobacteraceae bacterium]|nr:inositol monophosphatase family protein [Bryobacteraceae bacterium]